jgi:hypothetical protein
MSPAAAPLPVSGAWDASGTGVKAGSTSDGEVASVAADVTCGDADRAAVTAELATTPELGTAAELAIPEEGAALEGGAAVTRADEVQAAAIKATIRHATMVEIAASRTIALQARPPGCPQCSGS